MKDVIYFDDFQIGQKFTAGSIKIDKDYAINFAREYDPQYFHVDEKAAPDSFFKTLVVSGWQTAAVSMRLKTQTELGRISGGIIGMGLESVKWPRPVYPDDALHIVVEIVDKRLSKSKPGYGIIKYKVNTFNQNNELVMEMVTAVLAPCKTLN